ncbi:hypothetical protein [Halalkalibacter alkalisediminis]|uniref:DUF4199 domain-containing protein n=1 Tax=Halalkalibacter alkalisediminis TaxID=935616 RepID=A0ABV6NC48_9BACI|nr:hypothetical protein [Halalkalibacter alkalisediminis]
MGMIVLLLALFLIIGMVALLSLGAKRASTMLNDEEREGMIKQVYQYAVAFITLIMVIGGGVFAFMSIADYISPNTYMESFEDYKSMREYKSENDNATKVYSEEELLAQYESMAQQQIDNQRQSALNSFIKSLGWIIIPLPIFIFFQRRINQGRKQIN